MRCEEQGCKETATYTASLPRAILYNVVCTKHAFELKDFEYFKLFPNQLILKKLPIINGKPCK